MDFRLADLVISGAVFNTSPFSVHGQLQLRGAEMAVLFELTGMPSECLRGRHFEFEIPDNERPPTDEDRDRVRRFATQQIGPCSLTTVRGGTGEIRLEWSGQNGRILLELPRDQVRFIDLEATRAADNAASDDEDETDEDSQDIPPPMMEDDSEEEGYGLIPEELNRELERSAWRTDLEITGQSEEALQAMDEFDRMEDLIARGNGIPMRALIEKLCLPEPEEISTDEQASQALAKALAEIALFGVAFHVCEHCTARTAFRSLIENAGTATVFPAMRGTSWVQHFTTSDYCAECLGDPPF